MKGSLSCFIEIVGNAINFVAEHQHQRPSSLHHLPESGVREVFIYFYSICGKLLRGYYFCIGTCLRTSSSATGGSRTREFPHQNRHKKIPNFQKKNSTVRVFCRSEKNCPSALNEMPINSFFSASYAGSFLRKR